MRHLCKIFYRLIVKLIFIAAFFVKTPEGYPMWSSVPSTQESKVTINCHEASFKTSMARGSFTLKRSVIKSANSIEVPLVQSRSGRSKLFHEDKELCSLSFDSDAGKGKTKSLKISVSGNTNLLELSVPRAPSEAHFGLGQQYNFYDFNGHEVLILSQEQGIGRGRVPITQFMNLVARGSAGDVYSSYAPMPVVYSKSAVWFINAPVVGWVNLEHEAEIRFYIVTDNDNSSDFTIELVYAPSNSLIESTQTISDLSGRADRYPDWVEDGAIIAVQGGTSKVYEAVAVAEKYDMALTGIWIQDWSGSRESFLAKQVVWNWQLDEVLYPDWDQLLKFLASKNIKILAYFNPFLVPIRSEGHNHSYFSEAQIKNYLVKNRAGKIYKIFNTTFWAGLVDFFKPGASAWYKEILEREVIAKGFSGWMADYGESYPFDADAVESEIIQTKKINSLRHHEYINHWLQLNAEVARNHDPEILVMSRAATVGSQRLISHQWLGDQMVTWDKFDGLKSAVKGVVNGSMAGLGNIHSDIGGFTTVAALNLKRSAELFMRWSEFAAFTSMYRTHEGNQPEVNIQYFDPEVARHFSYFSKVFKILKPYRKFFQQQFIDAGTPIYRHPYAYGVQHECAQSMLSDREFGYLMGDDIYINPVVDKGSEMVFARIPSGVWMHLFTGDMITSNGCDLERYPAPIGKPFALVRQESPFAKNIRNQIIELGEYRE